MAEQQKPSLGRIVHFVVDQPTADDWNRRAVGKPLVEGDLLPAMIVAVRSDICLNLKVFCDGATDFWIANVALENETVKIRCWRWPARS